MLPEKFSSILEIAEMFSTKDKCLEHFEEIRWSDGNVISPFDKTSKVYKCKNHKYYCKNTDKYFNVLTGTFMENTKLHLNKWIAAMYLFISSKKGVSSYQLARLIKVTHKTAWFMLHRIRNSMKDTQTILSGEVECDESFFGGKNKNRHWNKKVPKSTGRSHIDKTPVIGMVQRDGKLVAQVILDTSKENITPVIVKRIRRDAILYTDEWKGYNEVDKLYHHEFVNHGKKQYVNGKVTTNRIEGFWGIIKRGIIGVYQMASPKHLQRYVDEFVWRYNVRKQKPHVQFQMLFTNFDSRLKYKDLVYG